MSIIEGTQEFEKAIKRELQQAPPGAISKRLKTLFVMFVNNVLLKHVSDGKKERFIRFAYRTFIKEQIDRPDLIRIAVEKSNFTIKDKILLKTLLQPIFIFLGLSGVVIGSVSTDPSIKDDKTKKILAGVGGATAGTFLLPAPLINAFSIGSDVFKSNLQETIKASVKKIT